jgi:hypothetical protein
MLHDDHASKDDDHTDAKDQQGNDELTFQDAQQGYDEGNTILAHLTQREQIPPSNICHILPTSMTRPKGNDTNTTTPAIQLSTTSEKSGTARKANATVTYQASMHATTTTYSVSQHESVKIDYGDLVNCGANGVVAGSNVRVISKPSRRVNVQGIDDHQVKGGYSNRWSCDWNLPSSYYPRSRLHIHLVWSTGILWRHHR